MEHFSREVTPREDSHLSDEERLHHASDSARIDPCHQCGAMADAPGVVYGTDDRLDLYQVSDPCILDLAANTVLLLTVNNLAPQPDGTYSLSRTITLQEYVTYTTPPSGTPMCNDQNFVNQQVAVGGFGTGFFITPSCVATSGHCVLDDTGELLRPISDIRFITGFKMIDQTKLVTNFKASQVFEGVQLIRAQYAASDFAIIQVRCLDGKSLGVPLPISPLKAVYKKESVFTIGYPSSLPAKLSPNAVVHNTDPELAFPTSAFFLTNFDGCSKNSGSPVCDVTNAVVGILVAGGVDYVYDKTRKCKVANTITTPGNNEGVIVQRISGVIGPVYDLTLQLNIGKEGLRGSDEAFGGRQILLRLKDGVAPVSIPHGSLDAFTSYTFPLNAPLMGINRIDDIAFIEINSPGLNRPWSDVWSLDMALLYVNGEQLLYDFYAQHTFDDKAGDNKWIATVTRLPDNYVSGNTLLCNGATPKGSTNWQQYNNNTLFVEIDTSQCNFSATQTPQYFASLGGDVAHWQTQGVNAIYYPGAKSFRLYVQYLGGSTITPAQANQWGWYVNWTGYQRLDQATAADTMSLYGGSTPRGSTNWKQYNENTLYVYVDTSKANFSEAQTPQFFASLGGDTRHWQTQGVNAIYSPGVAGFALYIQYLEGPITPAQANEWNWYVNWLGLEAITQ